MQAGNSVDMNLQDDPHHGEIEHNDDQTDPVGCPARSGPDSVS